MEIVKWLKCASIPVLTLFVLLEFGAREALYSAGRTEFDNAVKSSASVDAVGINPFDGKGLIYGVIVSSQSAATAILVLRDTSAVVDAGSGVNPQEIIAKVLMSTSAAATGNSVTQSNKDQIVNFDPPIRVYDGLSADASACIAGGWCFSVLFIPVDD